MLDNSVIHGSRVAAAVCGLRGAATVRLPPYHMELQPIELAWSYLAVYLKRHRAAALGDMPETIAAGLRSITAAHATGWFEHCGWK